MSNTGYKGISRYAVAEPPRHMKFGFAAYVGWQGKERRKFFSDKDYGGPHFALLEAIQWRNAMEDELGKPRTEKHLRASGVGFGGSPWKRKNQK